MSRKLSELFNRNLVIVFFYRRNWCCTQLPARLTLVLTVHFTQNWGSLGSLGSCSASSGLWSNETGAAVTEEIVESAVPGKSGFVLFCFLPSIGRVLAVSEDFPGRRGRVNALTVDRFLIFFGILKSDFVLFFRNKIDFQNFLSKLVSIPQSTLIYVKLWIQMNTRLSKA